MLGQTNLVQEQGGLGGPQLQTRTAHRGRGPGIRDSQGCEANITLILPVWLKLKNNLVDFKVVKNYDKKIWLQIIILGLHDLATNYWPRTL